MDPDSFYAVKASYAFRATTVEGMNEWQRDLRAKLVEALGLERINADLAAHRPYAEKIDTELMPGYSRERWRLWVEPAVGLPFYLLQPANISASLPLILTPHGHNPPHIYVGIANNGEEEQSIRAGERDIAVQAVQEGYLVIAPTTRGFGETRTAEDIRLGKISSCRTQLMHGLLVGRTPIGERVWDISRLIDWALQNLDVQPDRIGITGNSGGGTTTLFAAACDLRIAAAAPGSYFCTFKDSIGSIEHCDCNYIPGILRMGEMDDIAGLIAPRPFCAIAGEEDPIFPIAAVRQAYERLHHIYTVAGSPEKCRLYVGKGGHRYYKAGVWPFFREHMQR